MSNPAPIKKKCAVARSISSAWLFYPCLVYLSKKKRTEEDGRHVLGGLLLSSSRWRHLVVCRREKDRLKSFLDADLFVSSTIV